MQAFPWVLSLLASLSYGSVMTRVPFSILDLDMDIAISPRGDARWTPTEAVRETVRLLWELETFLQQRGLLNPSTTLLLNNNGTLCTWRLIMTSTTLLCGRGSQITPQAQMPI